MRQIKVGDKILYKLGDVYHIYTIKNINRYPTEYWVIEEYGFFDERLKDDRSATLLEI